MKQILLFLTALCLALSVSAQEIKVTGSRKAVRTSGDIGAVLLHSPVSGMEEAVRQGLVILSISIGLALAVVFVLSLGLVYIFTKPLNKMKQVALKLAQGEYKTQCNVVQNDEIGELANVLDLLAMRLDKGCGRE